ncbi:MAG: FAD:protein FMN transferase [Thermoleophilaceae bacterium]|nr:FAD:protein FMN transferase [Thermoleophilaceae bacterium]
MSDLSFNAMGTQVNLRIEGAPPAQTRRLLRTGKQFIANFDATLSRFKPESELSRINASAAEKIETSPLMSRFVEAANWAAEASDGLVDPTLTPALVRAGYAESRVGATPADLALALEEAPARRAASPNPERPWRAIELDSASRVLQRPAGLTLDSGGTGKGLAADLLVRKWSLTLGLRASYFVDCGGDIAFGPSGNRSGVVNVEDPFRDRLLPLATSGGAVATTSIRNRIWRVDGGAPSHHLIDPASGTPAWTGVTAVTALAPSALIAETFAKVAFLRGPDGARDVLASGNGGLIVLDDGSVEYVTPELESLAA